MNIFTLMGKIAINNQDANSQIDDTNGRAGKLAQGLKAVGKVAGAAGKTIAAGMTAGAAAMGKMMQSSIAGYADYEQLVGGVETLFKDSSGKMLEYANNAYKTAGMSANDYMTTVTSFSASLLQSMGGDTAAATEVANMALTDMADNANKMGTSMDAIQNAYQGFAKQNYTMLDNLKLGYGGTQSEMKRLLKDAQKITGIKYDINNLNDVYEAIHVIQTEMGITGTTAAEASETISGSLGMAKAAWQNLLVGIADGNQDLGQLVSNFVDAGKTAAQNIIKVLPDLVAGVKGLVDGIMPEIPGIVQELFPALLEGAIALIGGLATALPSVLSTLAQTISSVWTDSIWPAIQDFFKIHFGWELPDWSAISTALTAAFDDIRPQLEAAGENVQSFCRDVGSVISSIVGWLQENEAVVNGLLLALHSILMTSIVGALVVLVTHWNQVKEGAINTWNSIKSTWDTVATWFDTWVTQPISAIFSALWSLISTTASNEWETIKAAWEAASEWFNTTVVQPVADFFSPMWESISTWASNAWTTIKTAWEAAAEWFNTNVVKPISAAIGGVVEIINGIGTAWTNLKNTLKPISTSVNVKQTVSEARESGMSDQEINMGLASGEIISNAKGAVFSRATIFDTRLGKQMVGEAGPEAVAPISVLQGYVADAVNNSNSTMVTLLAQILDAVQGQGSSMEERMTRAFSSMRIDVNNREFARLVKAVT